MNGNARRSAFTILTLVAGPVASAASTPQHMVRDQEVVLRLPAATEARVETDVRFAAGDQGDLHLDLYRPADGAGEPLSVVVFANGGDRGESSLKDWPNYTSWGRLVTARGLAAVTFENRSGREGLAELFAYLHDHHLELGIDPGRILVWASSGNAFVALPYLQEETPAGVRAAVVYYGQADVERFARELPVFYVRAGRDRDVVNDGIDRLWERVTAEELPWTLVNAPSLHHGFDVLNDTVESRRVVRQTLDFLELHARAAAPVEDSPGRLARTALAHWFSREWAEAADAYRRYAEAQPEDEIGVGRHGIALVRIGELDAGIEVLDRALELGYDADSAHYEQARAHALSGRAADALALLKPLVANGILESRHLEDEAFDSLAGQTAFAELLASFGPPPAPETSRQPGAGGPAEVVYLGHSGWAVKTSSRWLVFDYVPGLVDGGEDAFAPIWASDLPLVAFVSHGHDDHWHESLRAWPSERPETTLIVGMDGLDGVDAVALAPRTHREVDGMEITTTASTDSGVGFLVEADGLVMFHAGDHARWSEGEDAAFRDEILWLRSDAPPVDLAFVPVATGRACRMTHSLQAGAYWLVDALRPAVTFPMHVRCAGSSVYTTWLSEAPTEIPGELRDPGNPGTRFRYEP